MNVLARYFLLLLLLAGMAGCKSKKKSLTGEEPVEISDFIDFFPGVELPWQFADTSLLKKENDSLLIGYKVFTQFVPDSIIAGVFGKNVKPKIYPMGKAEGKSDTYLFAKAVSGEKRIALVIGFDKNDKYVAAMPLLKADRVVSTQQVSGIDNRFTLFSAISKKNADGTTSEGKDVYVLNNEAGNFTLIMTDALDEKMTELINPIDTFSRKQKYTADYGRGKLNLFSFRDGRKADRLTFFIHFENSSGCAGELKGEAIIKSATQAVYREPGEPCVLQFNFTSNAVTVKEVEPCGSRRGLRCSFNGTYPRKKDIKPKGKSKKTTSK